jgi:membrane protease YdiL (CAAX protease family)
VPAEFWTEAARMATSGLLVAAVAGPVALVARAVRPRGEPLLPRWKPWRVPWGGFEVVVAFAVVMYVFPPVLLGALENSGFFDAVYGPDFPAQRAADVDPDRVKEANTIRVLWANVFALPLQLGLIVLAVRTFYPHWKPTVLGTGSTAGKLTLAVLAWLVLTPVVLAVHTAVNELSKEFGVPPESHPLTRLGGRPALDRVVFVLEACAGAPLREEVLIRGLMLAWCVGRIRVPGADAGPLTDARPVFVTAFAVAFAVLSRNPNAMAFAGVLVAGLAVLWRYWRTGARRARAVYATAAFFALMHSTWPNPVPLFVLGLGLGWLAVRTNGLFVPVLVHGLFNAVSAVYLLRGGVG